MNTNLREVQHDTIDGDVYQYFESLVDRIVSSGDNSDTKFLSFDSSEPPCPIGPGQFTRLKLTDGSCNLTSFTSSFIKLKIKTNITISKQSLVDIYEFESGFRNSLDNVPALYIGFKSGLHAVDHYRFYCDKGRGYVCEQSQAIYESAVTYFAKSQEEIEGEKGCYACSSSILKYDESVPGIYLTWEQVLTDTTKTIPIEFEVVLKYDDFAPLQFFKTYPNTVCGNLQLEFKINNLKSMVAYPIPLRIGLELAKVMNPDNYLHLVETGGNNMINYLNTNPISKAKFTNIGSEFITYLVPNPTDNFKKVEYSISLNVSDLYLTSAKSYINGYNIKDSKMNQIKDLLSTKKIYIPGQRIDQYSFSQIPTTSNMSCNTTQSLINCSSIAFIFPKNSSELTCSSNPLCSSIQLQLDNKTYPDKPFSTISLEHANFILNNLMFDNLFQPNYSLYHSLSDDKFDNNDNTNYMYLVATERLDSDPFVFDGITKDNCFITLLGSFYGNSEYANSPTKQPPIMLLCQDTLWELSSEGVNYYYNNKNIIQSITNN